MDNTQTDSKDSIIRKSDKLVYVLSKKLLIFLFVYYFVILVAGGMLTIVIACFLTRALCREQIMIMSFTASVTASGMLCSVQYIKRLYKACLTGRMEMRNDTTKCIGNVTYFFFRPFFAFAFSIVMVFMLLSGMFVVTGNLDYILNEKFVYLCVVLSCFLGYSVGDMLDKFEKFSKEKVSNFL